MALKVRFPREFLSFLDADAALQQKKLNLTATLEVEADSKGLATVSVTGKSTEPILQGEVLELIFEVPKTVYKNKDVLIKNVEASLVRANGQKLENLKLQDGSVKISATAPVSACFFYMH